MGQFQDLIEQMNSILTRKVDSKFWDWVWKISTFSDVSNQALPGPLSILTDPADGIRSGTILNSMCEPNVSFPEWTDVNSARKFANLSTDTQFLDATRLNPLGAGAGNAEYRFPALVVPGADGATFSVDIAESNSKPVTIGIYDSNFATVLASKVCVTTPGFKNFSVSLPAHSALQNHIYGLFIQCNVGAVQATPDVANAAFTPSFPTAALGTGTFAPDPVTKKLAFVRIALSQSMSIHNQLCGVNSSVYPYVNSQAQYAIETNSNSICIEGYNFASDGFLWLFLNGLPFIKSNAIPNNSLGAQDFNITQNDTKTTQTVRVSATGAAGPITNQQYGTAAFITAPRAIYLPAGASHSLIPARGQQRCIVTGDSIANGVSATNPVFQGAYARFRQWYPGEVILDCVNSQSFFNYVGSAAPPQNHADLQLQFAQYLVRSKPTDIVFALGANDYLNATGVTQWTAAAFQTALTGLVSDLLALAPQARIWIKSMGITTVEGVANGAGSTPPNYRTAASAVVAAINDPRVIFIDGLGANMYVAGDLVDTVHPNTNGQQKYGEAMIAAFGAVFGI